MSGISLSTRLVLLLTLTMALTLSFITAADYFSSRNDILLEQEARVESTVAEAVRDLRVRLSVLEESTLLLAEVIESREHTQAELTNLLREAVDERTDLLGAAVALAPRFTPSIQNGFAPYYFYDNGELRFADLGRDYNFALSAWYRDALSAEVPIWTEPYVEAGSGGTYMVTYSVPLFRRIEGERIFYGVVTADIALSELEIYLERMALGERGSGFLLSRSGKILASPNRNDWLKPWANTIPDAAEAKRWAELITTVSSEGVAASAKVKCLDGDDDCVVKLAPLAGTRWPVGAYYAEHEILSPLRDYLLKSVLSQLLTMILLVIGILWVARRITQPLRALASATVKIAEGNFHTPLPAPKTQDELGQLVDAFSAMQANLQQYVDELQQETANRNRLQGELAAATAIQMSMLPESGHSNRIEDGFKLWATLRPAKSVGGDLYTYQLQEGKRLFFAVGDVSDKGVPAALFMARAMTLLQQYVYTSLDAGEILTRLNDELVEGNDNCMFVTLFVGWLALDNMTLNFASGGHTAPSLASGDAVQILEQETGPALGLVEAQQFPNNTLQLNAGDILAVFTDGIDEAFNLESQQFGHPALNAVLQSSMGQSLEARGQAIMNAVENHQGDAPQSDDITLLLLQARHADSTRTRIRLKNDVGAVSTLQAWMAQLLDEAEIAIDIKTEMMLVAEEVVTNAFKYAELPEGTGVTMDLVIAADAIRMTFRDPGIAFDPLAEAQRSSLGADTDDAVIGGLGVHLLERLTDEQRYLRDDTDNVLTLTKYRG